MSTQQTRTVTLVPNQVILDLRFAAAQRAQGPGTRAFPAPDAHLLSHWAADLARRAGMLRGTAFGGTADRHLMAYLWEREIAADTRDWLPAERRALALQALEADRLLTHWADENPDFGGGRPWHRFLGWRQRVHGALAERALLTPAGQLAHVARQLAAGEIPADLLPGHVVVDGFAELTRLENRVLAGLAGRGVACRHRAPARSGPAEVRLVNFRDPAAELHRAAEWAGEQAAAGAVPVLVAVNGLEGSRDPVRRAFENVFDASSVLGFARADGSAYYMRAATALERHPLVDAALTLLELSCHGPRRPRPLSQISRWLLSPAWAGADRERFQRGLLEHRLRERGEAHPAPDRLPELAAGLVVPELLDRVRRWPRYRQGTDPAVYFTSCLEHWGWPGPLPRDPRAQEAAHRFGLLLLGLGGLTEPGPLQAVAILRHWCAVTYLSGGGGPLSPVQVVSPDDAVGGDFRAARLVNVHAQNWPAPPRPNELLPAACSRLIPRARAPGQLAHARRLTGMLLRCAPSLTCTRSTARQGVPTSRSRVLPEEAEESEARTEPRSLAEAAYPAIERLRGLARHPWLEERGQCDGLPVPAERTRLHAPVGVLELQSACPFAAYMVHRLQARFERVPPPFADPAFTGKVLHKALEWLYRPHLDDGTWPDESEIEAAVEKALRDSRAERRLPPVALVAERRRLAELLGEWLAFDPQREAGVLAGVERDIEAELAGFEIRSRVDRMDRMPDGRLLLLDYKSGALPVPRWAETRLTQPQLPLYAVLLSRLGERACGIALAAVRTGAMNLRGLGDCGSGGTVGIEDFARPGGLARRLGSWAGALGHWEQALADLLAEYRRGACECRVHHEAPLQYLGIELLLQRQRLEAWLQAGREAEDDAGTV